jgi:hypothetical protein
LPAQVRLGSRGRNFYKSEVSSFVIAGTYILRASIWWRNFPQKFGMRREFQKFGQKQFSAV